MEIEGMDRRTIVIGQVAGVPTLVKIGIGIVTVIADDGTLHPGDALGAQGFKNLVNDIGLARQEDRPQRGISSTADDDIALEVATLDLTVQIDGCLEAEVRPHQAQRGRGDHRLHCRGGDVGLLGTVTGNGLGTVQVNDNHAQRGIAQ